jgi:hypothetical protein
MHVVAYPEHGVAAMQQVALVQPPGRLHDWAVLTCLSGSQMYSTLCWAEHVVAAV